MDNPRSSVGNGEDSVGIPDDLRCKRSDGKQWRCTAMSMPDKTVCEKHYIQAKKRAANSAMRANLKKAKRKSLGENDVYLESKSDEFDTPIPSSKAMDYSSSGKRMSKSSQVRYSSESPPLTRSFPMRNHSKHDDESQRDFAEYEEDWRSSRSPNFDAVDSLGNTPQKSFDGNASDYSGESTDLSDEDIGQPCHLCRRNEKDGIVWCLKCDKRGYCANCIASWYSGISVEEIERICPACRGTCSCRVCLRGGNLLKVRIREIPVLDKLQYLHCLLSSVLPVIKQIHREQCYEVELEKKFRRTEIDLARTKLSADEQMCCNFCRTPITDYHRRCSKCTYDLCLSCCQDLRDGSKCGVKGQLLDNQIALQISEKKCVFEQVEVSRPKLNLSDKFSKWKANTDGSIPCPPREYGGCGHSSLNLSRIFKMNWVAKLVKNVEEMVGGCRIYDTVHSQKADLDNPQIFQCAHRENSDDNMLYFPTSLDLKSDGIDNFRKHWAWGEPIIVKQVFDDSSVSSWDPINIWRGIRETTDEKMKDENRMVKAIDCSNWSEVEVKLSQFIKGYSKGHINDNGRSEMLKLKDWPSSNASEEFILYQRPECISKLPLLEYIHSKWGLLNVAAKMPHYSLQSDVGPKILISYGTHEEIDGDSCVTNLSLNLRDMVYLLVHTSELKLKDLQKTSGEKLEESFKLSEEKESPGDQQTCSDERSLDQSPDSHTMQNNHDQKVDPNEDVTMMDPELEQTSSQEETNVNSEFPNRDVREFIGKTRAGAVWDVFRRKDVPKLTEYIRLHWKEFGKAGSVKNDLVTGPLFDEALFLSKHHKRKLKEEFGVEPWSFEQYLGQAVFVPAGCPFQVQNIQSTVQLGLDFLSPESLGVAVRLAEEIRCLPNDHEAKLQVLEVGKISLYAASAVIKEVQKLVLDPKFGAGLGFDDPNLTAMVSENLEKLTKQRQIPCA